MARDANVTPAATLEEPWPRYSGTGNLLEHSCASAEYTLIDGGATMYYIPFVGCINDRLDCCPFTARPVGGNTLTTPPVSLTRAQQTSPTSRSSSYGLHVYPQALAAEDGIMKHCADDYYSISGSCCPRYEMPPPDKHSQRKRTRN